MHYSISHSDTTNPNALIQSDVLPSIGSLPSDFFDQGPSHATSESGGEEEEGGVELLSSTASETFPSGKRTREGSGGI